MLPYSSNWQNVRVLILSMLLILSLAGPVQCISATQENLSLINVSVDASDISIPKEELYRVRVLSGKFHTKSGISRAYTLYLPDLPDKNSIVHTPYPLLVLIHGFLMTGRQHSGNAQYFAQRGFAVLTPDMTKILLGEENRMRNVDDILDQISWLIKQNEIKTSPLCGLIDSDHIGIAGNSAGGAVCLELLLEAQKNNIPIHAMCSLDGVPWDRTKNMMSHLKPINLLSLRAEPALCNYHGRMTSYLNDLKFPYNDVKINGSHHCDVENPTSLGCRCVCGKSNAKYRVIFQHLTYLYFRDTFHTPPLAFSPAENFLKAIADLKGNGLVVANLKQLQPVQFAGSQQIH